MKEIDPLTFLKAVYMNVELPPVGQDASGD
jgi:hypothetical protein